MKIQAVFFIAAALFAPPDAAAFSDDDFCRDTQEHARKFNIDKPAWIGREIRQDGMVVLCMQKTVEHRRFFNIDPSGLGRDWEQRLSAQWNRGQCRERTLDAIRNGWQIVEITRFSKSPRYPDGRQLRALAACP